eukprot:831565-Rhodomonas_salina.1
MLFPAKPTGQRFYGYYDNQPVNQFRADLFGTELNATLASQPPNLSSTPTPLWTASDVQTLDPDLACDMFEATLSSLPINISSPQDVSRSDIRSSPGGGCASEDVPTSPGGGSQISDSSPGGGSPTAGASSEGERQSRQRFPNASKHTGKRIRFGDKVPPICEKPRYWKDCQSKTLKNVTDMELAEYLIWYALEFTLPQEFYPSDNGQTTISCLEIHKATAKDVANGF